MSFTQPLDDRCELLGDLGVWPLFLQIHGHLNYLEICHTITDEMSLNDRISVSLSDRPWLQVDAHSVGREVPLPVVIVVRTDWLKGPEALLNVLLDDRYHMDVLGLVEQTRVCLK